VNQQERGRQMEQDQEMLNMLSSVGGLITRVRQMKADAEQGKDKLQVTYLL